jgi:pyroglutamyl-peptidase
MTMLRRRQKAPRGRPPREEPRGATRSHRRPRPDAQVPPQLVLKPEDLERKAPHGKRPARRADSVVLVTGFEPFGGDAVNPSWEVCERLPASIGGMRVEVCRVPCEFRRAIEVVAGAIERHRPTLVVSLGLAAGRTHIGVERVAINVDDARIEDNARAQPVDEPIAAGGPPAYFSTLPVKAMVAAMRRAGVPAEVSNSAGTFVCNHLMYGVLHFLAASGKRARAGFVHVPASEEMVLEKRAVPSMSIATMVRGIEVGIAAALGHARDVRVAEGSLD